MKNKENFICSEEISFCENQNFCHGKFVVREEEQKHEMQNLIRFQTVTDSSGEFVYKREKKTNLSGINHLS